MRRILLPSNPGRPCQVRHTRAPPPAVPPAAPRLPPPRRGYRRGMTHAPAWQDPEHLRFMLDECETWAVVGLGGDPSRTAYGIARFLQQHGKRIVPVHPEATTCSASTATRRWPSAVPGRLRRRLPPLGGAPASSPTRRSRSARGGVVPARRRRPRGLRPHDRGRRADGDGHLPGHRVAPLRLSRTDPANGSVSRSRPCVRRSPRTAAPFSRASRRATPGTPPSSARSAVVGRGEDAHGEQPGVAGVADGHRGDRHPGRHLHDREQGVHPVEVASAAPARRSPAAA